MLAPRVLEKRSVLAQLRCSGTPQLLQLMGEGFPTRCEYATLAERYRPLLPGLSAELPAREFVQALLSALELREGGGEGKGGGKGVGEGTGEGGRRGGADFALGVRRVFFSAGAMATLEQLMHGSEEEVAALVGAVRAYLHRRRWRVAVAAVRATMFLQRRVLARRALEALVRRARALVRGRRGALGWLRRAVHDRAPSRRGAACTAFCCSRRSSSTLISRTTSPTRRASKCAR